MKIEAGIHQSNVMLCDDDNVKSRFTNVCQNGNKIRVSKKTGKSID